MFAQQEVTLNRLCRIEILCKNIILMITDVKHSALEPLLENIKIFSLSFFKGFGNHVTAKTKQKKKLHTHILGNAKQKKRKIYRLSIYKNSSYIR